VNPSITWRLGTGIITKLWAKINASLWTLGGKRKREAFASVHNTLGPWIRNSSRYADVRNLAGYSIGEKVMSIYLFILQIHPDWKSFLKRGEELKG
jgi:hypothetical protein